MRKLIWTVLWGSIVACAPIGITPMPAASPISTVPSPQPPPSPSASLLDTAPLATQMAVADLSERLGIVQATIVILSTEKAELSFADPVCEPLAAVEQPGIVLGYIIRLQARDTVYIYHSHLRIIQYCGVE